MRDTPSARRVRCKGGPPPFEWTSQEFQVWAQAVAGRFGYTVRFLPVGQEQPEYGPPTRMGVFQQMTEVKG